MRSVFVPKLSIVRRGGEWFQYGEEGPGRAPAVDVHFPNGDLKTADPVPRGSQGGETVTRGSEGVEGPRFCFWRGRNYFVSPDVAEELKAAGYGRWLVSVEDPPPPAPPRVHAVPPSLGDAMQLIEKLEARIAELESPNGRGGEAA